MGSALTYRTGNPNDEALRGGGNLLRTDRARSGGLSRHRAWLQKGYDLGLFLCSGPKNPPGGGYLVARAESVEVIKTMFEEEPLNLERLAIFTFTEFVPVKRQAWTEDWFGETAGATGSTGAWYSVSNT